MKKGVCKRPFQIHSNLPRKSEAFAATRTGFQYARRTLHASVLTSG